MSLLSAGQQSNTRSPSTTAIVGLGFFIREEAQIQSGHSSHRHAGAREIQEIIESPEEPTEEATQETVVPSEDEDDGTSAGTGSVFDTYGDPNAKGSHSAKKSNKRKKDSPYEY